MAIKTTPNAAFTMPQALLENAVVALQTFANQVDANVIGGLTPINQLQTHKWFESDSPPAKIMRWGDRAFFGAAVDDTTGTIGTRDWLENLRGLTGLGHSGVVNTSGTTVTWVSGDKFLTAAGVLAPSGGRSPFIGQTIIINSVPYIIQSVTSDTVLVLTTSAGTQSNKAYVMGQGVLQSGGTAQVQSLTDPFNSASNIALLTGATSASGAGNMYAASAIAVNNHPTLPTTMWGWYGEAHRMNGAVGWVVGMEIEVVNRGNEVVEDPYNSYNAKQVQALQLGSGAGLTNVGNNNTTTALVIFGNGSLFNAGIMFTHDSLAASGPGGSYAAIQLPALYEIQGYSAAGTTSYRLYGDSSSNAYLKSGVNCYIQPATGNTLIDGVSSIVDVAETNGSVLTLRSTTAAGLDIGPTLRFTGKTNNGNDPYAFASIAGRKESTAVANYAGYLQFNTISSTGQIFERMRIDSSGQTTNTSPNNAASTFLFSNTNAGSVSQILLKVASDSAAIELRAHALARTATRYGVTVGGYTELVAEIGNGLLIGTFTNNTPIVFGTNGTERLRITGGADILPGANYIENFGALDKKFLTGHFAELWVETLVAQDTIATIGGRILVGPTTTLTSDLAPATTSIVVKHNQMSNGDIVYMEAAGKVEFMAITSGPSGGGPYTYTVTRDLDGSGANQWYAGDAVFNTGQTGNGFIDIYSLRGVKAGTEIGPTIVGNIRNSVTYNDWSSGWAIGNLKGIYGYSATTFGVALGKYAANTPFITIDATNGYRAFSDTSIVRLQINTSGVMTLNDSTGTAKITLDGSGGMTLDGKMQMLGSSSAIAIGVLPPLSSAIGTGIWEDRNGIWGISGVQQVETATVIGTITSSGNATVIVTAASMIGTPRTVQVAVINGDSASTVAGKIRTALAADATVAAFFTVSGSSADVILTDKYGRANDGTMNINIANGTCTGLTTVNSANTVAGSNTTQVKLDAATGKITAGAGNAILDASGVSLVVDATGYVGSAAIKFMNGTDQVGTLWAYGSVANQQSETLLSAINDATSFSTIRAQNVSGSHLAQCSIQWKESNSTGQLQVSGVTSAYITSGSGAASFAGLLIGASGVATAKLDVRGGATTDTVLASFSESTGSYVGYGVKNTHSSGYSGMLYYDNAGATSIFQGFSNSTHEFRFNNIASTPAINFLISSTSRIKLDGTGIGFFNHAPSAQPAAYTVTNPTTDRGLNVTGDTLAQVAQVLGTLIADLQTLGLVG